MKLQIIVILLVTVGISAGLSQIGDEQISIVVNSEGKAKISQMLFPKTFVSTIDVHIISEKISNLLAIDEKNILLGTTQTQDLLKIATLGASTVDLKYNADILTYESGVFRLKYNSELESRINLPPLSKLVSLNTIPIEITDREYILPPGDISLSFSIRPVTSKEFFVPVNDLEYKVEAITAAKIEEFSANSDEIQFIIKDKAIVLTIIPTKVMSNPNDALLNGEKVEFSQFHKNSTHSWIRIDPHEKGLVKILDTNEKLDEGGGCLIATATFGSEMAPQVQFLREIRDNQLMNVDYGRTFMSGFNSFYYTFSPYIADYQRENPIFKEFVKIGITPMLSSLSVMTLADSEQEILGFGIVTILINIGMYFVLPFGILYYVKTTMRTRRLKKSSWAVIFNWNIRSVLKKSLFGLIALFVLSASVPSAFAQITESEIDSPIKMVLDLTLTNLEDSLESANEVPTTAQTFYEMGQNEYQKAIDALESGNLETAEEHALIAMALFEDSASVIGELEDSLVLNQLPPGFGVGVGSTSDNGISNGQGLGTGDIPPGVLKQLTAANVFEIQEQITDIDEEVNELRQIAESNGVDVNLEDYDESINLAKEVLANGDIPNAQVKLALANEIKSDIIDQMNAAAEESQDERVQEFVDSSIADIEEMLEKGENLGLTKKAIRELEETLDVLKNGEIEDILEKTDDNSDLAKELDENNNGDETPEDAPGNSGEAPGQNKEDAPGNSGEAPGQNKEDAPGNSGDLPPGFEAAGDNPSENGITNGNGLGVGNIPPGLAKLFDAEGLETELPPGFEAAGDNPSENGITNGNGLGVGNIPPGQAKKFDDYSNSFEQSPDDYYENSYEASIDDVFEVNYDGTNKGNGNGKGLFGAHPGKSGDAPGQNQASKNSDNGNNGNGNGNNVNAGINDSESTNTSGSVGQSYTVQGFTALNNGGQTVNPSNISLDIIAPAGGTDVLGNDGSNQPFNFTPDVVGDWEIRANAAALSEVIRTITVVVNALPTADAGPDQSLNEGVAVILDGTASSDTDGTIASYAWTQTAGKIVTLDDDTLAQPTFTTFIDGNPASEDITFSLIVTDDDGGDSVANTVTITINDLDGNNTPTVTGVISDITTSRNGADEIVSLGPVFADIEDDDAEMTYSVFSNTNAGMFDSFTFVDSTLTIDIRNGQTGTADIVIRATDDEGEVVDAAAFTFLINP